MHLITRENSVDAPYGTLNDPTQHQVVLICHLPSRNWFAHALLDEKARDARPKSDHER
jgi:hypothetical protein